VRRDWQALERTASVRDPATSLAVADALREHALAQARGWPDPEERRAARRRPPRASSPCWRRNASSLISPEPNAGSGLLRAQPQGLDVAEARGVLGELEAALGQSDLVPALDAATSRARRA